MMSPTGSAAPAARGIAALPPDELPPEGRGGWRQTLASISVIMLALVTAGSVLVSVVAVFLVERTNSSQRLVLEDGQLAGRFTAAVDQLGQEGPDKLQVRLGGVYTLERVMKTSTADQQAVVEILAAFVRNHAIGTPSEQVGEGDGAPLRVTADVQAALTVLGRRPSPETLILDLQGVAAPGAQLPAARLARADLRRARLAGANLGRAALGRADLAGANLSRANLAGASLSRANLAGVDLSGADLRGANLSDAYGLTSSQLAKAVVDGTTKLPAGLTRSSQQPSPLPGASRPSVSAVPSRDR